MITLPRAAHRSRVPVAVLICALAGGCSPTYVLRAGWEEARILSARQPLDHVVHDTTIDPVTRGKLRLVQDAREFAERSLGLDAGRSFTSYAQLSRDTLALNVLAAPEFGLYWKTWWFPIVGAVPYKGYFNFERAREEARELEAQGYDVSVRAVSAFSTLGWLPDPLMSTTLRLDSLALVDTVIHEITHTTFFPAGRADFNESFANFVGQRGAIAFYCDALADPVMCEAAEERWWDARVFGRFFHAVLEDLREVYSADLSDGEKRLRKREVFERAAVAFEEEVKPELRAGRYGSLDPAGLDNAWVLGRLLYFSRLDDFERLFQRHGSLAEALQAVFRAADGRDPWEALDELVPPSGAR